MGAGEGGAGEEEGAAAAVGDDGHVGDDLESVGAKVVDDLRAHTGGWADVEDGLGGGAHGIGFRVGEVDVARLSDVAQHCGRVEGLEGEGFGADAAVGGSGGGVGGEGVVVLEDGADLDDAPGGGTEAGAAGVGVGQAVDAAPGVLGLVVGLVVRRAGYAAEAGGGSRATG